MWYQEREEGVLLFVKVSPQSKENAIVGQSGDFLKIRISAVPEKGKANAALRSFLARVYRVAQKDVHIVKGEHQSVKLIFMPISAAQLVAATQRE